MTSGDSPSTIGYAIYQDISGILVVTEETMVLSFEVHFTIKT